MVLMQQTLHFKKKKKILLYPIQTENLAQAALHVLLCLRTAARRLTELPLAMQCVQQRSAIRVCG